jgi:uncharacterized phiE125 gp8 family phage protein
MTNLSIKPVTRVDNLGLNITVSLPGTAAVSTADAKKYMRVDFSEDDDFIDALISSTTEFVQKILNRALISQTVIAEWDSVGYNVPLPYIGKESITVVSEVLTIDNDGTETELTLNSGYSIRNGKIKVATGLGLRATYTAGFGTASTDIPAPIITAIKRIVLGLYDRRDDEIMENNIDQLALNSVELLRPYIN